MRGDPRTSEHTRARLVHLSSGLREPAEAAHGEMPTTGWVPSPPAGSPAEPEVPASGDQRSALPLAAEGASLRSRALASAVVAYSAAHGHPLDHPSLGQERAGHRWATSGRVVVAAVIALAAVAGLVAVRAWTQVPSSTVDRAAGEFRTLAPDGPEPAVGPASEGSATDAAVEGDQGVQGPGEASPVLVHVVGRVVTPGLVSLAPGSRVADAVEAAGGAAAEADLAALNLAREVNDGEQVVVPGVGEVVLPPLGVGAGSAGPGTEGADLVDLNAADAAALDVLPGIGPVLAERIVAWRTDHGPFTTVEELREVAGIGPALLEDLRDLVGV